MASFARQSIQSKEPDQVLLRMSPWRHLNPFCKCAARFRLIDHGFPQASFENRPTL
jgi:hypothetical protein